MKQGGPCAVSKTYNMAMAAIKITHIPIHRHCAASLDRVIDDIWRRAGRTQAVVDARGMKVFSGPFNFWPMRGLP